MEKSNDDRKEVERSASSHYNLPMLSPGKNRSFHIKTFGCQMNVYDSDRMKAKLTAQGFRMEPILREADVIILNTCSIRGKAEQKVLSLLGELKPLKEKHPGRVIGVAGCVGQRMGRTLLQRVPHLDLVMGPDSVDRIDTLIDSVVNEGRRVVEAKFDLGGREYSQPAMVNDTKPALPSEYLTIIKGCDHFCTYCIVPFVRGREKSRSIPEILEDTRKLVARGTKEVVFLGQNINTYGKGTPYTLAKLIEQTNEIEGLERIRYVTSHPRDLGQDLIDQFGTVSKLCPQLHLPFQSGSNSILKNMSRLYTIEQYLEKIEALYRSLPEISLSTDVIVGFPGETDQDFEKTLSVMKSIRFSQAFLFKYSPRPGTKAFPLGDPVSEAVKSERLLRIQEVLNTGLAAENKELIGTTTPVLIESLDKRKRYWTGRNPLLKRVHVFNAGQACFGNIIDVEITESTGTNLRGYYTGAPRVKRENS